MVVKLTSADPMASTSSQFQQLIADRYLISGANTWDKLTMTWRDEQGREQVRYDSLERLQDFISRDLVKNPVVPSNPTREA